MNFFKKLFGLVKKEAEPSSEGDLEIKASQINPETEVKIEEVKEEPPVETTEDQV